MISENCAKCGKALERALCPGCVKKEVEEEAEFLAERLLELESRLTNAEGEIVRLQTRLMQLH